MKRESVIFARISIAVTVIVVLILFCINTRVLAAGGGGVSRNFHPGEQTSAPSCVPGTPFCDVDSPITDNFVSNFSGSGNFSTIGTGTITSAGLLTGSNGLIVTTGNVNLMGGNIVGASPLVFDGATSDANKTTFAITDPTAARTITFPNASGTVAVSATGPITLSANGDIGCPTCGTSAPTLQTVYNAGQSINLTSGNLTVFGAGSVNLTPTGASSFTSGAALNLDAGAALNLGATNATSVSIGRTGVTTTVNGPLSVTGTIGASNFSGTSSGTNTGDQTNISGNAATVTGLSFVAGKTLTVNNILTLSGTDSSTLNIGSGGTLGTNAYTSTAFAPLNSPTFTGTVAGITAAMVGAPSGSGTSSGTNTGDQTTITGNAGTATALATSRNINGVGFNGTADITVAAAAGTLTGTALNSGVVTSSLTTVGALAAGSIASGFGTISTANPISTTGAGTFGSFANGQIEIRSSDGTIVFYKASANTDAARGTAFQNALSAVSGGSTILLGPGTYDCGATQLTVPANVVIKGSGKNTTIIKSQYSNSVYLQTILLSDGDVIYDLMFDMTANDGLFRAVSPATSNSTVYFYNVAIHGGSDGIYVAPSALTYDNIHWYLYDCDLYSAFDAVNMGATNSSVELHNCYASVSYHYGGWTSAGTQRGVGLVGGTDGSKLSIYNSNIVVSSAGNNGATTASAVFNRASTNIVPASILLYNTTTSVNSGVKPASNQHFADLFYFAAGLKPMVVIGGSGSGSNGRFVSYSVDFYGVPLSTPIATDFVSNGALTQGMEIPTAPTGTPSASGGSIPDGTYYYIITALNGSGETVQGIESNSQTVSGGSGNGSVALTWTAVPGASSYKIYRTTVSMTYTDPSLVGTSSTNSFTDTVASPSTGLPPSITTAYVNSINPTSTSWITGGNVGIGTTTPGSLLTLGTAGATAGVFSMAGATSGMITLQPAAATTTSTYTLPAAYPTTSGYVLASDLSGNLSWVVGGGSQTPWTSNINAGGYSITNLGANITGAGALYVDSAGALSLGTATATGVSIGRTGQTTTLNGNVLAANIGNGASTMNFTSTTSSSPSFYFNDNNGGDTNDIVQITNTAGFTGTLLTLAGNNASVAGGEGALFYLSNAAAQSSNSAGIVGSLVDFNSMTASSTKSNVDGYVVNMPSVTNSSATNNDFYNGFSIEYTANNTVNGGNGNSTIATSSTGLLTWNGAAIKMPNLTQSSTGTITSSGVYINTGTMTTGGTQYGLNIASNGTSVGTLTGVNIGNTTGSGGTQNAVAIGSGWNNGIYFSGTGTKIDFASTSGNTFLWQIPASAGACANGASEGIRIFEGGNTTTQRGHICISNSNTLSYFASAFNSSNTDLAENYSTDPADGIEAGDLVALDASGNLKVVKSNAAYAPIVGVISTSPGLLMSGISEDGSVRDVTNPQPVALRGRVPVKVNDENGPIAVGDYLAASSTPGVAMKATESGVTVGRALDAFAPTDGTHRGTIRVMVDVGWQFDIVSANDIAQLVSNVQTETPRDPVSIIMNQISDGTRLFADFFAARVTAIRGYFDETFANQTFAKKSHQDTLCVGDAANGGETCITKIQLDQFLQSQGGALNAPSAPSIPVLTPPASPVVNVNAQIMPAASTTDTTQTTTPVVTAPATTTTSTDATSTVLPTTPPPLTETLPATITLPTADTVTEPASTNQPAATITPSQ